MDSEGRAFSVGGLHLDATTVGARYLTGDKNTKSHARPRFRPSVVGSELDQWPEDSAMGFLRDSRPLIVHLDSEFVGAAFGGYRDWLVLRAVLCGIEKQIGQQTVQRMPSK